MDKTVEYAQRRKHALIEEIRKIDLFLKLYEEFAGKNAREDDPEPAVNIQAATREVAARIEPLLPLVDRTPVAESASEPRKRAVGNPRPEEVIRIAREAMLAKGHPLTRRQILEAVEERGLKIGGHDPIKVVGTNLWRSKQFEQHEGFGYWPKDAPQPLRPRPPQFRGA